MATDHYPPDIKALSERVAAVIPPFQQRLDENCNKALAELGRTEAKAKNLTTKSSAFNLSYARNRLRLTERERGDGEKLLSRALNLFDKIDEFRSTTNLLEIEVLKTLVEGFHDTIKLIEWRTRDADLMAAGRSS